MSFRPAFLTTLMVSLTVLLLDCSGLIAQDDPSSESPQKPNVTDAYDPLECDANIPGLAELFKADRVILFGELHGTQQAPAFVGNAACLALQKKLPVRVGVEVPRDMQRRVNRFLKSEGNEKDIAKLTQHYFWKWRDGRSSTALLNLFDRLRLLRQDGHDVDVYLFDISASGTDERDVSMAKSILTSVKKAPQAVHLILTGNVHARISSNRWMGWHVKQEHPSLIALNIAYSGGTAWLHTDRGQGPTKLGGKDRGKQRFVEMVKRNQDGDFDGFYYVGSVSMSPPATLDDDE